MSATGALALTSSLPPEQIGALVSAIIILPVLIVWLVMRSRLKRMLRDLSTALEQLRAESKAALQAENSKATALAAEMAKNSAEAAATLADVQQRFYTHREVAERRANDASQQISRLEADLATTREVAAQLVPTQSRIKDLETALAAEQGRVKAQEQAIEATNARAADFEKRLIEAQELILKQKAEMQETAVELKKIRDEQAAYAAAGGPEAELGKAREATVQAEAKIANLQRALKAAEARVEMVQKEFMSAVGVATVPTPGTSATATEKKLREQEEKLSLLEAEARKRAREDGYKIAELEYRLSEALEALKTALIQAKSAPEAGAKATPSVEVPAQETTPVSEVPMMELVSLEAPAVESPEAGIPMVEAPEAGFGTLEAEPPAN